MLMATLTMHGLLIKGMEMRKHKLDAYDKEKLEKARDLIQRVYEYHYGDSYMTSETKRLETILSKLEYLIEKATKTH